MLPISELVFVARTLDEEGSSALALDAARAWGYEQVRFLRSSANHVFFCEAGGRDTGVLRFCPVEARDADSIDRAAEIAGTLSGVAPSLLIRDGERVLVFGDSGRYAAAMYASVRGRQVDEDSLTPEIARGWGHALARFHAAATALDPDAPAWLDTVVQAGHALGREDIADELRRLPASADLVGVAHGDPELDNVIWDAEGKPVFVDLDDVSRSWFAADVCFALRGFVDSPLAENFVQGYRAGRPLTDDELSWLPLFRRAHALVTLAGLERVLEEPVADDWPDWAKQLHSRLVGIAGQLREGLG